MERRETPDKVRIQKGWEVLDSDHKGLGKVSDVTDRYLIVRNSPVFGRDLYLPARVIDHVEDNDEVVLNIPAADIEMEHLFATPEEERMPRQEPTMGQRPEYTRHEGMMARERPGYTREEGMTVPRHEERYAGPNELVIRTERFVEERIVRNPTEEERRRFMEEGRHEHEPRQSEEGSYREPERREPPEEGRYTEPERRQ